MNWLTNFVRPKLRALVSKKEVPDNLWVKCPGCSGMLFHRDLEESLQVCKHCGHHLRFDPVKRLQHLFDGGQYALIPLPKAPSDPLKFRDQKRYTDRLKDAQSKTGRSEGILIAKGKVGGHNVVAAVFDFGFMGGSMGVAFGNALIAAADAAVASKSAFITIPASGGARMQEGILSLMQLPRSILAVQRVKAANLPYFVLLTDPTTGGVTASFAMLGDIHLSEPGALIGFAGARVIENTIRETLPQGFQRAEYLLDHGMVDMVVPRKELPETIAKLISFLTNQTPKQKLIGKRT